MKKTTSKSPKSSATVVTINTPPEPIMAAVHGSEEHATETTTLLGRRKDQEQYSVFTETQKRLIIVTASIASTFSPLSANIYYPALNSLAADLHVSHSLINLTIMSYMVRITSFTEVRY
jgi:hypothetical protein